MIIVHSVDINDERHWIPEAPLTEDLWSSVGLSQTTPVEGTWSLGESQEHGNALDKKAKREEGGHFSSDDTDGGEEITGKESKVLTSIWKSKQNGTGGQGGLVSWADERQ